MNTRDDLDRRLSAWFSADAVSEPEHLLGRVLARTARTRRRPAWLIPEGWNSMTSISMRLAPSPVPLRAIVVIALLITALAAAAFYIGSHQRLPETPYGLAANGRLAYVSEGHLVTSRTDGSDVRSIATDQRIKGVPTWSRDGTRLAYLAYRDPGTTEVASLIVTNPDGTNPVSIVTDAEVLGYFSWSPDGAAIVFSQWVAYPGQRDRIFIAPADGSVPPVQVGDPDLSAFHPAMSPDGTRIAFVSDHCQPTAPSPCGFGVHVMDRDGSNERELTNGVFEGLGGSGDRTWGLEWSPDGRLLAFAVGEGSGPSGVSTIRVLAVDGAASGIFADGAGDEYAPTWSPDGSQLAFLRRDAAGVRSVVISPLAGGAERVLASGVAGYTPQWSPDGAWLSYVESTAAGEATLRIVRLDGSAAPVVIHTTVPVSEGTSGLGVDAIGWQRVAP